MMSCQRDLLNWLDWTTLHWLSSVVTTVRMQSEWHFLQRLDAIKGNKNIHVDTCELCKQESDYTIHAAVRQHHFLLMHGFCITGMYQDPLQVVCWQYGGMCWYTKYMFSKILVLFFFVNILINRLYAQINKQNKCTWIFISLWQRVKEVNQSDGNTHTKMMSWREITSTVKNTITVT